MLTNLRERSDPAQVDIVYLNCCFSLNHNLIIKRERFQPVVPVAPGCFFSLCIHRRGLSFLFYNATRLTVFVSLHSEVDEMGGEGVRRGGFSKIKKAAA